MDEDLGLSDRDKELKKWNAPYVYREFPKMLFRGTTSTAGRIEMEQRIVASVGEEVAAEANGWLPHPQRALEAEDARQGAVGIAAAERAWTERHMSASAQDEAAAAEAATSRQLGEIPERPRRPSRRRLE